MAEFCPITVRPTSADISGPIVVDVDPDEAPLILLNQQEDGYRDMVAVQPEKLDELIAALIQARVHLAKGGAS